MLFRSARTAWSFTAVHELVHLWLGQTGISGTDSENNIERYCNDVAGEFLLPASELRQLAPFLNLSVTAMAEQIGQFAQSLRVSRAMVAYRVYRAGLIGKTAWTALDKLFKVVLEVQAKRGGKEQDNGGRTELLCRPPAPCGPSAPAACAPLAG